MIRICGSEEFYEGVRLNEKTELLPDGIWSYFRGSMYEYLAYIKKDPIVRLIIINDVNSKFYSNFKYYMIEIYKEDKDLPEIKFIDQPEIYSIVEGEMMKEIPEDVKNAKMHELAGKVLLQLESAADYAAQFAKLMGDEQDGRIYGLGPRIWLAAANLVTNTSDRIRLLKLAGEDDLVKYWKIKFNKSE